MKRLAAPAQAAEIGAAGAPHELARTDAVPF
jgi:hypothetical protein